MASRRPADPDSAVTTTGLIGEIDQAIKRLRVQIAATQNFGSQEVAFDDAKVDAVQKAIRDTIREVFGSESAEYHDHSQHRIWHGGLIYLEARSKRQEKFIAGIPHTITMLESLISRLEDRRNNLSKSQATTKSVAKTVEPEAVVSKASPPAQIAEVVELPRRVMTHRICVIHGQNDALKNAVSDYLQKLGLEPVALHKQQSGERNLMEKIESLPEVDYAVVLLTDDDFVQPGKPSRSGKAQARNVLFELGYYIGRLGKAHVCALYKGHNKPPRDYEGITCLTISDNQVWRRLLGMELKEVGFEIKTDDVE